MQVPMQVLRQVLRQVPRHAVAMHMGAYTAPVFCANTVLARQRVPRG